MLKDINFLQNAPAIKMCSLLSPDPNLGFTLPLPKTASALFPSLFAYLLTYLLNLQKEAT